METILVVDDDPSVREMAARALELRGFRVLEAQDGAQALEIARSEKDVHLLLTDVIMPILGGVELARLWRELRPAARVLFMTGLECDRWPEGSVIQKPFVSGDLAERVLAALHQ